MSDAADGSKAPTDAWQPLTFGGVAAFAPARAGRVLLVGLLAALVFGICFVWLIQHDYSPVILQAIQQMPESARVTDGRLQGVPNTLISESKPLAIAVTPESSAEIGQDADIQLQLRQTDACINSTFQPDWGLLYQYDRGGSLNLSRSALEPWWGAWHPVLLAGAGVGGVVLLFFSWVVLGTVYMGPAKFLAWFSDRDLSWRGAWKLCFAALVPAGLVMTFGVVLYGWHAIDLVQLSFFWLAHLVMGWVYAVGAIFALPRLFSPGSQRKNPFA
ncbi:MAG TPA: hypothetical protein VH595_00105 [Verrucomicrobiae bacterium]|jgi:hypothetical protein|nr:hypothetical protein [Verrucomicrobiae bacterium]